VAWLSGWNYRKEITISSGSALTDYQISITVDTATLITAGKLLSNCNDINFTDSGGSTLLNYWIESGCNTSTTKIWVKVPSITASPTDTTIYIYYGNSSATAGSNGVNTFILFDHFDGSSLDTSKWYNMSGYHNGTISIASSIVTISGNSGGNYDNIQSVANAFTQNTTLEALIKFSNDGVQGYMAGGRDATINNQVAAVSWSGSPTKYWSNIIAGIETKATRTANFSTAYRKMRIDRNGTTSVIYYADGVLESTVTLNVPIVDLQAAFYAKYNTNVINIDYCFIRKYIATGPIFSIDTAEAMNIFSNRKILTINNNSGGSLTDYQVPITVTYEPAMQSNFSDIRFVDINGNLLPYWLESKTDSNTAMFWIRADLPLYGTSPTGDNIVYMYYGNANLTSASDGINTFVVFDDFATGSSEQWTMSNVTADRTTNHRLNINGVTGSTSAYIDKGTDIGDFEFLYTYTRTSTAAGQGFGTGVGNTITNNFNAQNDGVASIDHLGGGSQQYKYLRVIDAGTNYETSTTAGASNTQYYAKLTRLGNVYNSTIYSDAARTTVVWTLSVTQSGLTGLRYVYGVATGTDVGAVATGWIKDIRIRKYASPEPTISTGSEQSPVGITADSMIITKSENPCRTGFCTVTVDITWRNDSLMQESFIPSIKLNGTPVVVIPPLTSVTVNPSGTVSQQFIMTGLSANTYTICPDPN
jgi:hypothetical protein